MLQAAPKALAHTVRCRCPCGHWREQAVVVLPLGGAPGPYEPTGIYKPWGSADASLPADITVFVAESLNIIHPYLLSDVEPYNVDRAQTLRDQLAAECKKLWKSAQMRPRRWELELCDCVTGHSYD